MARYIDADALLERVKSLPTFWADAGGTYGRPMKYPDGMYYCEDIPDAIESQPTEDVAPVVHGRWVEIDNPNSDLYSNKLYECSNCGNVDVKGKKYCSECGFKNDFSMM